MTPVGGGDRRFLAEINVVPLVDVVLVLLIIFMVTAPLLYRGVDLELPQSAVNTIKPDERTTLTITKSQEVFIDNDRVPLESLERRLQTLHASTPNVTLYLRADRTVPYGIVMQVMDAVKRVGIDKLGMVTEPTPDARS
jgi:biopolymer transport protein TolR